MSVDELHTDTFDRKPISRVRRAVNIRFPVHLFIGPNGLPTAAARGTMSYMIGWRLGSRLSNLVSFLQRSPTRVALLTLCYEGERMAKEMMVHIRHGLTLPLRTRKIRFAVTMKNGLTSHTWGVETRKAGDTYVYCRETMKEVKVSLHDSGRQHVAFTKGSGHEMTPNSRFWKRWRQPSPDQRPPVPSVKLLFPSWGTTLGDMQRKPFRKLWDTNEILIEGDEKFMTAVLFFVMNKGHSLHQDTLPSGTIAVMSLSEGKELHVIACRNYERNFRESVEKALSKMPIRPDMVGEVFTALLVGDDPDGCPYLLPVLLDGHMRITADMQGSIAYTLAMEAMKEKGYCEGPAAWDSLPVRVREAWKVIGTDWMDELPESSKLAKLVGDGFVEVERT